MGRPLLSFCDKFRKTNTRCQPRLAWYDSENSSDTVANITPITKPSLRDQQSHRHFTKNPLASPASRQDQDRAIPSNLSAITLRHAVPCLHITGMSTQFAPYLVGPEALEQLARKWVDVSLPSIRKMLSINHRSGIQTGPIVRPIDDIFWEGVFPPSITEIEQIFRTEGIKMAATACTAALREAGPAPKDITHIVAVTGTSAGSPVLLHGLGCGGGIAAMRVGANIASGASARGQVARMLVVAVKVCSASLRCNIEAMARPPFDAIHIAPALYSDGASAFVLCNELAPEADVYGFFELINWTTELLPESAEDAYSLMDQNGRMTTLATSIPAAGGNLLPPAFEELFVTVQLDEASYKMPQHAADFDWAVHTGGSAILDGVAQDMGLEVQDHLRGAYEAYRNRGNTSSVSVLAILDELRRRRDGRDMEIACTFGPGIFVDLALLRRCQRSRGPPWG